MASIDAYFKRSPRKSGKRKAPEAEAEDPADVAATGEVKGDADDRKAAAGPTVGDDCTAASPSKKRRLNDNEKEEEAPALTPSQRTRAEENKQKALAKLKAKAEAKKAEAKKAASKAGGDGDDADSKHTHISLSELPTIFPESWMPIVGQEFSKPYFQNLLKFLAGEEEKGSKVYPPKHKIFRAFDACPFEEARVVIIGQDPYHQPGQAEGLCFSVPKGVKVPSSLQNIYKELSNDIPGFVKPKHGHLKEWAEQGVLLLNTSLTVRAREPASHSGKGWETFTDAVIANLAKKKEGVVFLLWGKHAQKKEQLVPVGKHCILKAVHPSGMSASQGFFGCKHFSKTNKYLADHGEQPINWQISP